MLPVVHWITRSGRSAVLVVMCASSLRVGSVDTVGEYVYPAVVPVPVRPTPARQEGRPLRWHDRRMQHALPATPSTVHWGYFDPRLEPALVVASGDLVAIETLTNHAGDAPDLMMDPQIADVFATVTDRGPGPHLLTGPIAVDGARPGDVLQVDILTATPRLPYGSNLAAHWGHLYDVAARQSG